MNAATLNPDPIRQHLYHSFIRVGQFPALTSYLLLRRPSARAPSETSVQPAGSGTTVKLKV